MTLIDEAVDGFLVGCGLRLGGELPVRTVGSGMGDYASMLEAALRYAAHGRLVLPLHNPKAGKCSCGSPKCNRSIGKHPRLANGVKGASRNPKQITGWWKRWPEANIGIATGPESGILVIDVDGKAGQESLSLLRHSKKWPKTLTSRTGRLDKDRNRVGWQYYFRYPEDGRIGNSSKGIGAGMDVRGDGGYVVAPPSLHKSGVRYRWEEPNRAISAAPDWLIERLNERSSPPKPTPKIAYASPWLPEIPPVQLPSGTKRRNAQKPNRSAHELEPVEKPVVTPELDLNQLKILHRHDSFVAFARAGKRDLAAIRGSALDAEFPKIQSSLGQDSYVSINASYRHRRGINGDVGKPDHKGHYLRYLCACYCDIDFYRKGLDLVGTIHRIEEICGTGELPPISCVVETGRGIWLLWLLRDQREPSKAHCGAWTGNPNNHSWLHSAINRTIQQKLVSLGADPRAVNPAKYIRIPGSCRSDTGTKVAWWFQSRHGSPLTYTLWELRQFFRIEEGEHRLWHKEGAGVAPNRRRGWEVGRQNSLTAFKVVKKLRGGGFSEGCRNYAALIYATLLKLNGHSREYTRNALDEMAQLCEPVLSAKECQWAIQSAFESKMLKWSYQSIADYLEVTPLEAKAISKKIKKPFPASKEFEEHAPISGGVVKESRTSKMGRRRVAILQIHKNRKDNARYSLREMQSLLLDRGIVASHITISADYRELGIAAQRATNVKSPMRGKVLPARR